MRRLLNGIIISLLFFLLSVCGNERENVPDSKDALVDDLGVSFVFDNPPKRVISLAPSLTEMIYALDAYEALVGNTLFCNYPPEAKEVEKVGDLLTFDYEKILQLKPDLIFISVEGNTKAAYDKFSELGLKIFVSNPRDYAGIKKSFRDISHIFNKEEKARKIISSWDSTITSIKKRAANFKPQTVMFMVDLQPAYLAGRNTFINEMIEFCGMKNIAAESPLNYPVFNREEILNRNPDYIFYSSDLKEDINILEIYPEWSEVNAIKNHNFIVVDRDLFSRPGPRYIEAIKVLSEKFEE